MISLRVNTQAEKLERAWLGFTLLGHIVWFAVAVPMALVLSGRLGDTSESFAFNFFYLASQGLFVGVAQWLILRRYLHRAGWWIVATALGWPTAFMLVMAYLGSRTVSYEIPLLFAAVGLGLGLAQWLVLRAAVQQAWRWLAANVAIWTIGGVLGASIAAIIDLGGAGLANLSVLAGLVGGLALAEWLRAWVLFRRLLPNRVPAA